MDATRLIDELCQYFRLPSAVNGKLEYLDEHNSQWVLEAHDVSGVLCIYSRLDVEDRREETFQKLMALNHECEITQGATLSYISQEDVFAICFSMPLQLSDFVTVKNIIENLVDVKQAVESEL